jgi:hypothetical protein
VSFDYVRKTYGVPAKRGMRVRFTTKHSDRFGTITRATHYVWVRFDGSRGELPVHPTDPYLTYSPAEGRESGR